MASLIRLLQNGPLLFAACWLSALAASAQPTVVISEIMYHPVEEAAFNADGTPVMDLYEDLHEFVELHNYDARLVSLAGWEITGGVNLVFTNNEAIGPGEFLVLAKDPARLAAVPAYGLEATRLIGPWQGRLSNDGETLKLKDAAGDTVDSVIYSASFPWAIGANALGAGEDWTGLKEFDYQYRGRSLERASFKHSGHDPANWLASPLPGNPSPGKPNAANRAQPKPVVIQLHAAQASNGQFLIRRDEPVRLEALFSATNDLSEVQLEFFVDNINLTNETHTTLGMLQTGHASEGRFSVELPAQPDRSVVRYRVWANRGDGPEVISPRADDPFAWHAYFVTPTRTNPNPVYDVFISTNSIRILRTNISQEPRRYTRPDPPGKPRPSWNATQPVTFVFNGVVYEAQMRHHGSQFRRDVGRKSYKVQFPRYRLFNHHSSVFLTDKDYQTVAGHALMREVGLPTSLTRSIDLYLNSDAKLTRLEQEEYDEYMLERHHGEQALLNPGQPVELAGELYKSMGVFEPFGGPYGLGNAALLPARTNKTTVFWTPLQRYEWTYSLQNHGWRGHAEFKELLDKLWAARNRRTQPPGANEIPKLRAFFEEHFDIDKQLTYQAASNWMVPWDDTIHNWFLWRQRNGKWSMLPWDFDSVMNGQSSSGNVFTGAPFAGPNYIKESFMAAFREEFKKRVWELNNTLLHPDNIASLGLSAQIRTWSTARQRSVNTQVAQGTYQRPNRPVAQAPANGAPAGPFAVLQASEYIHTNNPAPVHASTTWFIRQAKGSYYAPVYKGTSTNELTALALPSFLLHLGETYFWKCLYTDEVGHSSSASVETSFVYGRGVAQPGEIVLNEIMADNQSSLANAGKYPDWIELFNPSAQPQSLDGLCLTDDLFAPYKFVFPANLTIPAQGYLVVWCDSAKNAPGLHTGFGLSAEGQTVALFANTTNGPVLKNIVTFGLQLPDLSVGRVADSSVEWTLNMATPNAGNHAITLGSPANLKINEWMANPTLGEDWFELFNADTAPVALGGFFFTDNLSNPTNSPVPPLTFISAGNFLRFDADGQTEKGADHVGFRLNGDGGAIGLYTGNGAVIDSVMYGPQASGVSQGCLPDGAPTFFNFLIQATPGTSNYTDRDGDSLPDAWEIANGFNPFLPFEAALDSDADGLTVVQEFLTGTDPHDPHSSLAVEAAGMKADANGTFTIRFTAEPGKSYTVQCRDTLEDGDWKKLADVNAEPTLRQVDVSDPIAYGSGHRFYRLVTPQLP